VPAINIKARFREKQSRVPFFSLYSLLKEKLYFITMVQNIDQRAIDTVRCLAADVVKGANSGHPGNAI
jgi:hypothetical protein